ncbi:ABC transporter substrate-binding protein [Modestobacter sp. VKM Ac-2978]|uniref:ABC transporter substrate-binding protein n=1 Tax=Modestobacter sp. VKM Ac-2978 TaxID=3004132 RepID=UPI0022AAD11F|nr:ABC transporter substrate-binding protein [Modestobacter sp. VKM Ac-2978]MCZ2849217.1 ABC transporter substrate-binding protein [Modestobacter sp. VKM Ac-2978]
MAVLLGVTACGGDSDDGGGGSSASEGGATTVTVSYNPASQFAPMFVGMDQGIFEEHGVQLELVPQTDVAAIISGVASGQYDFGFATVVHVINARANNIPIKAVATPDGQQAVEEAPDMGNALVAGPDSGISDAGDLEGKTLGVIGLASLNTLAAQELADAAGVDPTSIQLVQMPFGQMPAALAAGDIDAAVVQSPFIAEAVASGSTVIAKPNVELFADSAVGLFTTSEQKIAEDEEVVRGFAAAMVEAQEYAAAHVDEARQTLVEHLGLTPEAAAAATWCTTCTPELDTDGFATAQELMEKYAGLEDAPGVDEYVWKPALDL